MIGAFDKTDTAKSRKAKARLAGGAAAIAIDALLFPRIAAFIAARAAIPSR